jgi:hypothetical protein
MISDAIMQGAKIIKERREKIKPAGLLAAALQLKALSLRPTKLGMLRLPRR